MTALGWWVFLGLSGCNRDMLELASKPIDDAAVVAVFPQDGARDLVGAVPLAVVLGSEAKGEVPDVTVAIGDEPERRFPCTLDVGGTLARCGEVSGIPRGKSVSMHVDAAGQVTASTSVPDVPCSDAGWDLLRGLHVDEFGGGDVAAAQVDAQLADDHAFGVFDGWEGEPGKYTFMVAPADVAETGALRAMAPGFTLLVPSSIDADGRVSGAADSAWLTTGVRGQLVNVLMLDVRLTGRVDGETLVGLRLEAVLPMLSIAELADAAGNLGSVFLDAVDLDVDRDGDGEPDAASFVLSGTPEPAVLRAWEQKEGQEN
jgi:hypothetical protein